VNYLIHFKVLPIFLSKPLLCKCGYANKHFCGHIIAKENHVRNRYFPINGKCNNIHAEAQRNDHMAKPPSGVVGYKLLPKDQQKP